MDREPFYQLRFVLLVRLVNLVAFFMCLDKILELRFEFDELIQSNTALYKIT